LQDNLRELTRTYSTSCWYLRCYCHGKQRPCPMVLTSVHTESWQPHSLFLGSTLATQDRISLKEDPPTEETYYSSSSTRSITRTTVFLNKFSSFWASVFRITAVGQGVAEPKSHADRENNTLAFVQAHLSHGVVDMVLSLLSFAVLINSLCVTQHT
jgi:hypothetical protein